MKLIKLLLITLLLLNVKVHGLEPPTAFGSLKKDPLIAYALGEEKKGTLKIVSNVPPELACTIQKQAGTKAAAVLEGHRSGAASLAWHPCEDKLATSSYDGTIKVWDPHTGQCLQTLCRQKGSVFSVAWHPTEKDILVACEKKTLALWNVIEQKCFKTMDDKEKCTLIGWTTDDTKEIIYTSRIDREHRRVLSWNPEKNVRRPYRYDYSTANIYSARPMIDPRSNKQLPFPWSPKKTSHEDARGHRSAQCRDKLIEMVRHETDEGTSIIETKEQLAGHLHEVTCLAWNHDGTLLASSSRDRTTRIWHPTDHTLTFRQQGLINALILFDKIREQHNKRHIKQVRGISLTVLARRLDLEPEYVTEQFLGIPDGRRRNLIERYDILKPECLEKTGE